MKLTNLITLILLLSFVFNAHADIAHSFAKAKYNLYHKVYSNSGRTIYTNCIWKNKKVDLSSCGLENSFPKKHLKRARRIEAEHVIPASWLYKKNGTFRQCYLDAKLKHHNPRKYCQTHDTDYRNAHNDLVNLFPSVGQINAERSNKPYSDTPNGKHTITYRGNGRKIILTSRVAIPDRSIRGDIARIAFYMAKKYGTTYSKRQENLFKKWNNEDPVSTQEMKRNHAIIQQQGTGLKLLNLK